MVQTENDIPVVVVLAGSKTHIKVGHVRLSPLANETPIYQAETVVRQAGYSIRPRDRLQFEKGEFQVFVEERREVCDHCKGKGEIDHYISGGGGMSDCGESWTSPCCTCAFTGFKLTDDEKAKVEELRKRKKDLTHELGLVANEWAKLFLDKTGGK